MENQLTSQTEARFGGNFLRNHGSANSPDTRRTQVAGSGEDVGVPSPCHPKESTLAGPLRSRMRRLSSVVTRAGNWVEAEAGPPVPTICNLAGKIPVIALPVQLTGWAPGALESKPSPQNSPVNITGSLGPRSMTGPPMLGKNGSRLQ